MLCREQEEESDDGGTEAVDSEPAQAEHTQNASNLPDTEPSASSKDCQPASADKDNVSSKSSTANATDSGKKRKSKWKGKQPLQKKAQFAQYEQSSRGMSFKRMEAYGMHSEVKRVKKLRARDKRRT